jgi:hypothetical protein
VEGLLFFRIHVKGFIEFFCDAGGGQDILFSRYLNFSSPPPVINNEWPLKIRKFKRNTVFLLNSKQLELSNYYNTL